MRTLLLIFFIMFAVSASAEENPLGLSFFGSFVHSEKAPNSLFFFSEIKQNDSFELRRALRTKSIDTIVLASDGGSVWEALTMAGIIHDQKLTTYVPQMSDESGCYSACAFMFFAGQTRVALGTIGVHQVGAYDNEADSQKIELGKTQQITQFTTSEIIGFLNEFQTPAWVFEKMFRSRDMYIFTEIEKVGISVGEVSEIEQNTIVSFLDSLVAELRKSQAEGVNDPPFRGIDASDKQSVKLLQTALNAAGCSAGQVDGIWGRRTEEAAGRFAAANGFVYSGLSSISVEFLHQLKSEDLVSCPPLVEPKTIAGSWSFRWSCVDGNRFNGSASIQDNGRLYNVIFTNEFGQNYSGSIELTGRQFSFYATQLNGSGTSEGSGIISTNWLRVSGTTEASCDFVGSKLR